MAVCRHKLQGLLQCMHWSLPLCAALSKPFNKLADLRGTEPQNMKWCNEPTYS